MLKEQWEELKAQVEAHGPEAIRFMLAEGDIVDVLDVQFSEDAIVVELD